MASTKFRKELIKIMPGYKWTVHRQYTKAYLSATGIQSSGFNRMSTLEVNRWENDSDVEYEVKSSGYGRNAHWLSDYKAGTLARALRGLQDHYSFHADNYSCHASDLQSGRKKA